jgi:hypothetical protein
MDEMILCSECLNIATWIRYTQFFGNHPFCDEHAKNEENFGKNSSYEEWIKINE